MIGVYIISIVALFYFLGKAADILVFRVRKFGERLGVRVFFLGLVLGLFTSIPEFALGINAVLSDVPAISMGNLFGGVIVLFGLILGGSAIMNRKIKTDGKLENFLPVPIYILLGVILGFDGKFNLPEAVVLVAGYLFLIFYYFKQNHLSEESRPVMHARDAMKNFLVLVSSLAVIILCSNLIVRLTLTLLARFALPAFVVGLIAFSIGTNLPEIVVTIRSWKRHVRELSLANIIGSSIANVFIAGILALMHPVAFETGPSYFIFAFFVAALSVLLLWFYKTGSAITKREGVVLVFIYAAFLFSEVGLFAATP